MRKPGSVWDDRKFLGGSAAFWQGENPAGPRETTEPGDSFDKARPLFWRHGSAQERPCPEEIVLSSHHDLLENHLPTAPAAGICQVRMAGGEPREGALMRSRRLPGSREPGRIAPETRPQAAPLFDGVTATRPKPVVEAESAAEPPAPVPFRMAFGARSLVASAIFLQVAVALWCSPRLVPALEYLSLHTANLLPLAALGAVGAGLLVWAWWFRGFKVAVAFCVVSVAWWLLFLVPSL